MPLWRKHRFWITFWVIKMTNQDYRIDGKYIWKKRNLTLTQL